MTTFILRHTDRGLDLRALTTRAWRGLVLWHARASQRRALARLTSEQLADIGLTRGQAMTEADKYPWQA